MTSPPHRAATTAATTTTTTIKIKITTTNIITSASWTHQMQHIRGEAARILIFKLYEHDAVQISLQLQANFSSKRIVRCSCFI